MVNKLYRQVACKDRLPTQEGRYLTSEGWRTYKSGRDIHLTWTDEGRISDAYVEWWLEKVELPSPSKINDVANNKYPESFKGFSAFKRGAEWVINQLKGAK